MIYLIGGAPRAGKSRVAKMILSRKNISWLALDFVRDAINYGIPKLDLVKISEGHDWKFMKGDDWWDNMPNRFYPFLEKIIEETHGANLDYVFEGDCFLPKQAVELSKKFPIKACFLGSSTMSKELLEKIDDGGANWHRGEIDKEKLAAGIRNISTMFQQESLEHGIPYFDTGLDHDDAIQRAYAAVVDSK